MKNETIELEPVITYENYLIRLTNTEAELLNKYAEMHKRTRGNAATYIVAEFLNKYFYGDKENE